MKICLICPHFLPHIGGGEQLVYDIAKNLLAEGHEVRVVSSNSGGVTGHVPYEGIDSYYYNWKLMFGHPVVKKKDLAEHIRWAEIVHTAVFTPARPSLKLARKYGKPCMVTVHEVIGDKWYWFVKPKWKAFAFKWFEHHVCKPDYDAVHVVSDSTKRDFEQYIGKRDGLIRVYNSSHMPPAEAYIGEKIDFREHFGLQDGEKGFLYFGRPSVNKGVFVLEEAIAELRKRGALTGDMKFCFLLAAQPADVRRDLLARMEKDGITENVVIRDSVPRMSLFKLISGADYVIVPSITEGFGFCAVETCAIGRPIIHSDGGSLPEVVFGRTLSFKNRDASDLANCLEKVQKEGADAFAVIPEKKFEEKEMTAQIMEIYRKLYAERTGNGL